MNLLTETLGNQIPVNAYLKYINDTKKEVFGHHIQEKDDRESEHFHNISALGVSIIARDKANGGNLFLHNKKYKMVENILGAATEIADDLLNHSLDLRKKQSVLWRKIPSSTEYGNAPGFQNLIPFQKRTR